MGEKGEKQCDEKTRGEAEREKMRGRRGYTRNCLSWLFRKVEEGKEERAMEKLRRGERIQKVRLPKIIEIEIEKRRKHEPLSRAFPRNRVSGRDAMEHKDLGRPPHEAYVGHSVPESQ